MTQAYEIKQITPFVTVSALKASIAFYTDFLGFACGFSAENYAYIHRDGVGLRLIEAPQEAAKYTPEQACYIDVSGIDELYAGLSPRLNGLPQGRVRPPFDQDYGQREFHVKDPDGFLIFFGEAIAD